MSLIDSLAQAIATMEGFFTPGSVANRGNNPGNLTSSPYATGTVPGMIEVSFSDAATGWTALQHQLDLYAQRGLTLEDLFTGIPAGVNPYYPSGFSGYSAANQSTYLNYVTTQLGVGPSTSLTALYDSTTSASVPTNVPSVDTGSASGTDAGSTTGDLLSWLSGSSGGDGAGGVDWGGLGIGIAVAVAAVLVINRLS